MPVPPAGTALAGGTNGPRALRPLLDTVLDALTAGAEDRAGPLPAGGPDTVARAVHDACHPVLPDDGTGPHTALRTLVHTLAAGAADPADPHCAAHLHCPPLALATAADLAAAALNPSMDSWDQAPAASALESLTSRALAALVYPHATAPDALITTGGTESNQLGLLLAREAATTPGTAGPLQIICGANAHHSIHRSAWLLGLPTPITLPTPNGTLTPDTLHTCLTNLPPHTGPLLITATAGTTDSGAIDPLPALADLAHHHRARLHIDAAYGGPLLFSDTHTKALQGLDRAHTVALDLHKLGWQPVAAGLLAVPDPTTLTPLTHQADYLNADDDTEAGLPDLLHRSLRTTRRPDILKIAVTLKALGRHGIGTLVDRTLADLIEAHPRYELHSRPTLSTVLFRPTGADHATLATIRRTLLTEGRAVLGRATTPTGLWLKVTLLNPHTQPGDLTTLLTLVEGHTPR
ncbi:putative L-2,4-diaminobutyrate decarboxylase [Streptomyces sp. NBRC 110611]|uniref:pyridoxal phosphate-dependent decarboxylase family protein n=1 Tax=Streptomyces sp. NBRC 110611 TaxID=1621259 RepID=UPI00082D7997|nr:pyridoxal-dependent decarboxylase [Streptomyces sp. NBRC 110611]GAU68343.1 putative L-2,4-diaminobutyrate decarboxylase [Streptomyces sp. NBRC 110611]